MAKRPEQSQLTGVPRLGRDGTLQCCAKASGVTLQDACVQSVCRAWVFRFPRPAPPGPASSTDLAIRVLATFVGLDPQSPIFLARGSDGFAITRRVKGEMVYVGTDCSNSSGCLYKAAGLYGATSLSPRRSFAVKAYSEWFRIRDIHELLGYADAEMTINLCEPDPVKLGAIVAKVL